MNRITQRGQSRSCYDDVTDDEDNDRHDGSGGPTQEQERMDVATAHCLVLQECNSSTFACLFATFIHKLLS